MTGTGRFERRGRVAMLWYVRADENREAAVCLWKAGTIDDGTSQGFQLSHYRPATLLMGLSLEAA